VVRACRDVTMSDTMLRTRGSIWRAVGRSRVISFRRGLPVELLARFGMLLMVGSR